MTDQLSIQRHSGYSWGRGAHLTAIELENFQAIGLSTRIDIAPLTFLCGPNSAGKSAISDALGFVRALLTGSVPDVYASRRSGAKTLRISVEVFATNPDISHPEIRDKIVGAFSSFGRSVESGTQIGLSMVVSDNHVPEFGESCVQQMVLCVGGVELVRFSNVTTPFDPFFRPLQSFSEGLIAEETNYTSAFFALLARGQRNGRIETDAWGSTGWIYEPLTSVDFRQFIQDKFDSQIPPELGADNFPTEQASADFSLTTKSIQHTVTVNRRHELFHELIGQNIKPISDGEVGFERFVFDQDEDRLIIRGLRLSPDCRDVRIAPDLEAALGFRFSPLLVELDDASLRASLERYFGLGHASCEPGPYREFAEQEDYKGSFSLALERAAAVAARISRFLSLVFVPIVQACQPVPVRSDRTRISSDHPIHLGGVFHHSDPRACISNEVYQSGLDRYVTYKGDKAVLQVPANNYSELDKPIILFAQENLLWATTHQKEEEPESELVDTFSARMWRKYLPSLSRYVPLTEVYEIVDRTPAPFDLHDIYEPGLLNGSFLAYPLLFDQQLERVVKFDDVGSGLSFVLPVVAAMGEEHLRFIEQPELHLHPAAQQELCDLMIASPRAPTLIETHSDIFFSRVAQRLRETAERRRGAGGSVMPIDPALSLGPSDVRIYYFQPSRLAGTRIEQIELDEQGTWMTTLPDGFLSNEPIFERLTKMRSLIDRAEMVRIWPWIEKTSEPLRDLLLQLCYVVQLQIEGAACVYASSIAEQLLREQLFVPFRESGLFEQAGHETEKDHIKVLNRFCTDGPTAQTLTIEQSRRLIEEADDYRPDSDPLLHAFRRYWLTVPWRKAWRKAYEVGLKNKLRALATARNSSAHARTDQAQISLDLVELLSPIVFQDRPGLLFDATGYGFIKSSGPKLA